MEEKVLVADTLSSVNNSLKTFGDMISQTENQQLRQKLQQMRNDCETSQFELFTIAKNKGYYQPAEQATPEEIQHVKQIFSTSR